MLKSWLIQNFKPILDSGNLPLAPVTVLAGRNSSGKSSLIQSILMIAQTLSNPILDLALLPNGPIVQLGTFEDILSEQTHLRTIIIGFELGIGHEGSHKGMASSSSVEGQFMPESSAGIKSVKITSEFRSASSSGVHNSAIEASKVTIESVFLEVTVFPNHLSMKQPSLFTEDITTSQSDFCLDIKRLSSEELKEFLKDVSPEYSRFILHPTAESNYIGAFTLKYPSSTTNTLDPSLVTFSHFLPRRLIRRYNIEDHLKRLLIDSIELSLEFYGSNSTIVRKLELVEKYGIAVPKSSREVVAHLCENYTIANSFSGQTLDELITWYKSLKVHKEKRQIVKNKVRDIVVQAILEQSNSLEQGTQALEAITNNIYVENLEAVVDQTTQFFTSKIRYLGPLRADPQAVQKFAPSSELDDVGAKGEYAAAVYDANKNAVYTGTIRLVEKMSRAH